jgi:hypothetical protein
MFTRYEETVKKGPDEYWIGSDPPTASTLGLTADQRVDIVDTKYWGQSAAKWDYYGQIVPHMDYYDGYNWSTGTHVGHNVYGSGGNIVFSQWKIRGSSAPTDQQIYDSYGNWFASQWVPPPTGDGDCNCDDIRFAAMIYGNEINNQPVVWRVLNRAETTIIRQGQTPVGQTHTVYLYTYRILTVTTIVEKDPSTITLSAGAVMTKE